MLFWVCLLTMLICTINISTQTINTTTMINTTSTFNNNTRPISTTLKLISPPEQQVPSTSTSIPLPQSEPLSVLDNTGYTILGDIMNKMVFNKSAASVEEDKSQTHLTIGSRSSVDNIEDNHIDAISYEASNCHSKDNVPGVCFTAAECYKRGGRDGANTCHSSSLTCCVFEYYCGEASSETISHFRSPDFPLLSVGSRACDFDIVVQNTVCAVRVDFVKVLLSKKLGGVCDVDQLVVLNSIDGPTVAQCGDLSGYSTTVAVMPAQHKPLKIALVIQNEGYYMWDITATQLKCSDLTHFHRPSLCGVHYSQYDTDPIWTDDEWDTVENTYKHIWWNFPEPVFNTFYYGSSKRSIRTSKSAQTAQERIIKGTNSLLHEFPWQVAIFINKMFFCGGAVINKEFVLTAAHCFLTRDTPAAELIVYLGDHDLTNKTESIHEIRTVRNIYFHSHFHPFLLANDIALLKLNKPVQFSHRIQPVCLPQPGESYTGEKATVVGWGITSFPMGQPSNVLQKLDVEVISNQRCARVIEESVTAGMLCASPQGLQGTCFGDSGGPLTFSDNSGREVLIGIVSFGVTGCAVLPGFPDLYTRVTEYLRWIDANAIPSHQH